MRKRSWKKLLPSFLTLCILGWSTFIPSPPIAEAGDVSFPELDAQAAVLMEFSRGEIIYARNADKPMPPASLAKIMTLLLAYEALRDGRVRWDDKVIISKEAWQTGGSQMFLDVNEAVAFGELITGMATISANDACVAIAEHLSGSESQFVAEMNRKAQELGLTATTFQNSSGLPHPDQYSSAMDMARLAHYYLQTFPEALTVHSLQEYTYNDILQHNRNPLLGRFPGADGLKTGHTDEAGFCLIATAEQKGMRFIAVLLNGSSHATRLRDSEILLNYAFRNHTRHPVFAQGEAVTVINITGGVAQQLGLQAKEAVEVTIPFHRSEDLVIKPNYPPSFAAPVSRYTPLGSVSVYLDDVLLAETALLAADSVEKAGTITLIGRSLAGFFSGIWSRFTDWLGGFFN